ncbi:PilZ domain-containing protein [Myxococcota bacterium]
MTRGSGEDGRVSPRYSANFLLYHAGKDTFGHAYTRNISEGGCFVETCLPVEKGTEVDVEMYVDLGEKAASLVASARVMWANRTQRNAKLGMGLGFLEMEEDARKLLLRGLEVASAPQLPIPGEPD